MKTNQVPGQRPQEWKVLHVSVPTPEFPDFCRNLEEVSHGSTQTREGPHSAGDVTPPHLMEPSLALWPPQPTLCHAAGQTQKRQLESESQSLLHPTPPPLCPLWFSLLAPPGCGRSENPWASSGSWTRTSTPEPSGPVTCSPA